MQPVGPTLYCGAWVSHCGGFSVVVEQGLQDTWPSAIVVPGVSCLVHVESPDHGTEPIPPALAGRFFPLCHQGSLSIIFKKKKMEA